MTTTTNTIAELANKEYKYGFVTEIESDAIPGAMHEGIIRIISAKKDEPESSRASRLRAFRHWLMMEEPKWPNLHYPPIDYQKIIYYAAPKPKKTLNSFDEVDPEALAPYETLG